MRLLAKFIAAGLLALGSGPAVGQMQNFDTPDDLKPTHALGCITMKEVQSQYTPPDFMVAYKKCMQADRYDDAMPLLLLAGAYAWYDTHRVPDRTAHDAFQVLQINYALNESERPKLLAVRNRYAAKDSPELAKFCADIKRVGPPNYSPVYMVSHGMDAFLGKTGPLKDIDGKAAWKETLGQYLHCDLTDLR